MSTTTNDTYENAPAFDEFSPRRIISYSWRYADYLISKWVWIVLLATLTGTGGALRALLKKPLYKAEISFAIDEERVQHNRSEFAEFSEQLGLAPVDGGNVFSSMSNIAELLKSRLLIEKTLRKSVNLNGREILFADFFLDSLEYRSKWVTSSIYPSLRFADKKADSQTVLFENNLIKNIYKKLTSDHLAVSAKGKETSITAVSCETPHPLFSKYFVEALLGQVAQYYIDTKTERSRINLAIIEKRTDSVKQAFVSSLYGKANFQDADLNVIRQSFSVQGEKKQTDIQILRAAYVELSRNLESAKTSLMNNTPMIQIIDSPILPLDEKKPGILKNFIIFFIVGAFIAVAALTCALLVKKLKAHR